jgi:hypothetical protein
MSIATTWLLLVSSVSGENKTVRMRIWRGLKASGAAVLRDGVYLLPESKAAGAAFREQADEVTAAGGRAHILRFASDGDAQQCEYVNLFDRTAEYARTLAALDEFVQGLDRLDEGEARRRAAALRRDVDALAAIDFFPGPARRQVETGLGDAENAINARFAPDEPHAARGKVPRRDRADYRGRTWATRARPWVDRVASAWLIRRFVDPKAKFLWLKNAKDCPRSAVGFDFDGAEFTHIGSRVTFEVLAAGFGLEGDAALARLGRLVHYLDVGGVPVPEAAGFAAILAGARSTQRDDDKLLAYACGVMDALYASFRDAGAEA